MECEHFPHTCSFSNIQWFESKRETGAVGVVSVTIISFTEDQTLPMRCCRIYKQGEEASSRCGPVRQCLPPPSAGSRCTRDLDVEIHWVSKVHDPNFWISPWLGTSPTPHLKTVGTCFLAGSIVQRSPSQSVPGIQHCCYVVALQLYISFCTLERNIFFVNWQNLPHMSLDFSLRESRMIFDFNKV